ncbi:MAG: hypothetical protein HKN81_08110 [Gammaproteobacteria bacterium]|nr:hypothetical protein [Gammaproteobacteria bacterium]
MTFLVFLLAVACLGLGVLVGREPLRGSCGGSACANCTRRCERTDQSAGAE